ncbi:MAG: transcription-repair coupling factor, partial [Spirochaetia bacterium]|nr:transcription-repair coupling factor [Spirochaetia bacterium]
MILKPIADKFTHSDEFMELKFPAESASIEGIAPSSFPFIIGALYAKSAGQYLVIADTSQKMQDIYLDLSCLIPETELYMLPPWEKLPYEQIALPEKTERERITAICRALSGRPGVFVTSVEAIIRKLPSKNFFLHKGLLLEAGVEYSFKDIIETLSAYGYLREPIVETFGQFSVKGGIIDIFLPTHSNPVRLDFFGEELESIREFDILSQISIGKTGSITVFPRRELLLSEHERETLLSKLSASADAKQSLEPGEALTGIEDIMPAVVECASLLSFFDESAGIILCDPIELSAKKSQLEKVFDELYNRRKEHFFCLPPAELLDPDAYERALERGLKLQTFMTTPGARAWKMKSPSGFQGKIKLLREELERRKNDGWQVIITTGFEGQARRLADLLAYFEPAGDFFTVSQKALCIIVSPYKEGLEISSIKTLIIADYEIFGKSYRKKKQFIKKSSKPIDSFIDLKPGDYVVHINHGIGIFRKIERMSAGGVERDFLLIEYAGDDKLYVSLDQITLIQKYIGMDGRVPRLDALGKKSAWNRIKDRVRESVEEIAKELIEIYSKRSALKGFQYPPDTLWQEEFESLFEYEETPDQITAIEDVKDDMESSRPMDRLICGDVGFGKTEVAIRAAFKAVMAGRQAAVLVPTTILAMQHFNTFTKRFADYPISIEMMSRFRTKAQISIIKDKLASGNLDIVIGTHSLLAKDIVIKNLGLLVIDEEQKFGVKHKEQLKKLRSTVDVMTLSATPIPRTLHMSLAGMRDLSTIATPPENRQTIETYVLEENPDILQGAIKHEIERNGQVFYVHNRVQTIDAQAKMIESLVPGVTVCVAHGQMDEHALEDIMIDFLGGRYDILVSTSIIESGLDMPNVNTIIINRSDTFGLSQLYQMKGRVGRSEKKAYAYLFYPRSISLTEDAQKRLRVISEYSELGSGFKIAMKDLEIRGAGNILGREQSGNIMEVGFELYCQMLEDAVRNLKGGKPLSAYRTPVFINTDFYIPDSYIADERQKIEFYKRFESCADSQEVDGLKKELIDRFGTPPEKVMILIELEEIRAIASALRIDEIIEQSKSIKIRVTEQSVIDSAELVKQIAVDKRISVDPKDNEILIFNPDNRQTEKKLEELKKWLQ